MFRRTQPLPYGVPSGPGSVKCACRAARVSKRLGLNVQLILSRRLSVRTSAGQPIASLTGLPARLSISTRVSIVNFAVFLFTATDTRGRETIRIPAASDCFTLHEKRAMGEGGANVKGGRANWRTSERRLGIGAGKVLSLWAAIAISDSFNLNPAVHPPHGQARPLLPAISNCGAAHPSGDNRFFRNRLSRGTIRVSSGRNCRI